MFIGSFLVLFCLPKKVLKKAQIGHHGQQFDRSIQLLCYCMASLLKVRSSTVLLAGLNRSSFAYILYQVRNPSTFKAFLVGQQ